jgi:hypothetical protein
MECLVLRLTPAQWSSARQPGTGRLIVDRPAAPARKQQVAVRVELAGHIFRATIVGTVTAARRSGAGFAVEVTPDSESAGALRLLDAAARGEPVRFRERPARYLVKVPAAVVGRLADVFMQTLSLSQGGCSLRWSGAVPRAGQTLRLRFGAGSSKFEIDGVVCWTGTTGSSAGVGIRFTDPRSATTLGGLLGAVARAGAPRV